ncbi:hypothetical protein L211DRAFT_835975, partial [Terfezia boudieri ATCC MYA-4762]
MSCIHTYRCIFPKQQQKKRVLPFSFLFFSSHNWLILGLRYCIVCIVGIYCSFASPFETF